MPVPRRVPARPLVFGFAALLLGACADSPTGPTSYVHEAGGAVWVAVAPPAGLPDLRTWTPFVAPGSPAQREVKRLHDESGRARRAGELERAAELEAQAARLAAESIATSPPPVKLLSSIAALDAWTERAEERLASGSFPGLDSAAARVRELRNAARASLVQGDTNRAVLEIAAAAEAARGYAPLAVALRLVTQAEARIDDTPDPSQNLRRARHLLRTAREAMATGDQTRAMKRAWYALQLIELEEAGGARE